MHSSQVPATSNRRMDHMKKTLATLALILAASSALSQTATFSGTVTDTDGQAWIGGKWGIEFLPNPSYPSLNQYYVSGIPLSTYYTAAKTGLLDGTGSFTNSTFVQNNLISPAGSQWKATFCPNATSQCFSFQVALNSSSLSLTSLITTNIVGYAPRFPGLAGQYGYSDTEVLVPQPPVPGSTYFSVTAGCQRYFNNLTSSWACSPNAVICGVSSNIPCLSSGNVFTGSPQAIKAGAVQSTDLVQIQNNSGTPISGFNSVGQAYTTTNAGLPANTPQKGSLSFDTTNNLLDVYGNTGWAAAGTVFTAAGDLSGTPSSQQVIGIRSQSIPTLAAGYLHNLGGSFTWDTPSVACGSANIPCTNTANTFTTGVQLFESSSPSNIPVKTQGFGVSTSNIAFTGMTAASSTNQAATVAIGEWAIVFGAKGGSSPNPPVDTLGNTWVNLGGGTFAGSNTIEAYGSNITHAGADSIGIWQAGGGYSSDFNSTFLVQGLASSPVDVSGFYYETLSGTTKSITVVTTGSNELLLGFGGQRGVSGTTCTPSISGPWTTGNAGAANAAGSATNASLLAPTASSYTMTVTYPAPCAGTLIAGGVLAVKIAGSYTQTAALHQYLDSLGTILSNVDANGEFNPPQFAGVPATTPGYGTHAYDTTTKCDRMYDQVSGWICVGGGVGRTAGTNGFYSIAADGTYTEWLQAGNTGTCTTPGSTTGCLNNNTPTTITLPHSIPTAIISISCADDGPRVAAGNVMAIGGTPVAASPIVSVSLTTGATGVTAFCTVVGY